MIPLFIVLFLLLLTLPDLYIWLTYVRGVADGRWTIAYWTPTALAFVALGC